MSRTHDPDRTIYMRRAADHTIASADYKRSADDTIASPDYTIASAGASSPLGDPAAQDGSPPDSRGPAPYGVTGAAGQSRFGGPPAEDRYLSERSGLAPDPITPAAKRWFVPKSAVVAAVVIRAVGAGSALALTLVSSPSSPH